MSKYFFRTRRRLWLFYSLVIVNLQLDMGDPSSTQSDNVADKYCSKDRVPYKTGTAFASITALSPTSPNIHINCTWDQQNTTSNDWTSPNHFCIPKPLKAKNWIYIYDCPEPSTPLKELISALSIPSFSADKVTRIDIHEMSRATNNGRIFEGLGLLECVIENSEPINLVGLLKLRLLTLRNVKLEPSRMRQYFEPVPKLKFLILEENSLTELASDSFINLPELTILTINRNQLTNLTHEVFKTQRNLTDLDLSNNKLQTLSPAVFGGLNKLTTLKLHINDLENLPRSLLENCTQLKTINLSQNKLKTLPEVLFHKLKELKKLQLNENQLEILTNLHFKGLDALTTLDLKHNKLIYFEPLNKLGLMNWRLEELCLSHNKLGLGWRNSTHLLVNNGIEYQSDAGISLEKIHLRNNSFRSFQLPNDIAHKLKELDLSYNRIKNINLENICLYQKERNITINLINNSLSSIDLPNFSDCGNQNPRGTLKLELNENPFICSCESYDILKYTKQSNTSNYDHIKIQNWDELNCSMPSHSNKTHFTDVDQSKLYCSLDKMKLSTSKHTTLKSTDVCPKNCTCSLRASDLLFVINCSSGRVPLNQSWNIPNTVEIYGNKGIITGLGLILSDCNIQSLNEVLQTLPPEPNIKELILSSNSLKNINGPLPKTLKVLDLSDNHIENLDEESINMLMKMEHLQIKLSGNNWKCDCGTKYLRNFILQINGTAEITDKDQIYCEKTKNLIIRQSEDQLCRPILSVLFFLYTLVFMLSISLLLAVVCYKYRREIKVKIKSLRRLLPGSGLEDVTKQYKYDAFVSCSPKDEEFVEKYIVSPLENSDPAYKLCWPVRDWIYGDSIPEQIVKSVANSRRTIVLLSRNYLNSTWSDFGSRTAHLKAIKEDRISVIVILLEDIGPIKNLDSGIELYLKTNTYIKWGDPLFWKKLKKTMPQRKEKEITKKTAEHNDQEMLPFYFYEL